MRLPKLFRIAGFILIAVALLGCNLLSGGKKSQPAAQMTQAAGGQESTVSGTPIPGTTALVVTDLPSAALAQSDLPAGFNVLSEEELSVLGLEPSQIEEALSTVLSKAEIVNFSAFTNPNNQEVVASMLLSPLTKVEQFSIDVLLKSPDQLIKLVGNQVEGVTITSLDLGEDVGNSSAGFTIQPTSGDSDVNITMILSRHDEALQLVFYGLPQDSDADITAAWAAQIVDNKLKIYFGK